MSLTPSRTKAKRTRQSGSSQRGKRLLVSAENIKLTPRLISELTMVNRPDKAIDFSDAPEAADFRGAVRGRFYRPVKKTISIRLDADVIAWVRSRGGRYQTRINAILREIMERSVGKRSH